MQTLWENEYIYEMMRSYIFIIAEKDNLLKVIYDCKKKSQTTTKVIWNNMRSVHTRLNETDDRRHTNHQHHPTPLYTFTWMHRVARSCDATYTILFITHNSIRLLFFNRHHHTNICARASLIWRSLYFYVYTQRHTIIHCEFYFMPTFYVAPEHIYVTDACMKGN